MRELRYTLLADGPSDRALVPIITWLLIENGIASVGQQEVVDNPRLPRETPQWKHSKLAWRIQWSLELYPCDLLFVHRDAEREPRQKRVEEIESALNELAGLQIKPTVCIVPVRMQEAWLLFDEQAIRSASGNPNGRMSLNLPRIQVVEGLIDPKETLKQLLQEASGLHGRRLKNLSFATFARRVAEFIEDYSPLRALPAFAAFESELRQVISEQNWTHN